MTFEAEGWWPRTCTTSKRWCDLILRVWHVDPLRCPVCQNPMRVIAVIDDPGVAEKIPCHLGAGLASGKYAASAVPLVVAFRMARVHLGKRRNAES